MLPDGEEGSWGEGRLPAGGGVAETAASWPGEELGWAPWEQHAAWPKTEVELRQNEKHLYFMNTPRSIVRYYAIRN